MSSSHQLFSLASQPDMIRSIQKDQFYVSLLKDDISEVLASWFGSRSSQFEPEVQLISDSFYFGLAMIAGIQTPGEEYCDLQMVEGGRLVRRGKKWAYYVCLVVVPYVLARMRKSARKVAVNRVGWGRYLKIGYNKMLEALGYLPSVLPTVLKLHLAVFYIAGMYFTISHRITGIQYIYTRKLTEKRPHYAMLGILILIQIFVSFYFSFKSFRLSEFLSNQESENQGHALEESAVSVESEDNGTPNCSLCLSSRRMPTATECGHVFCWDCISEWCAKKPECPLCRTQTSLNKLLLLSHYN